MAIQWLTIQYTEPLSTIDKVMLNNANNNNNATPHKVFCICKQNRQSFPAYYKDAGH